MAIKIMLVDDEKNLVDPMAYTLNQKGFETIVAYSGEEALEKLSSSEPDVISLDWSMPGLSGLDVVKTIRSEQNFVPIIMVTGKSAKEDIVAGLEVGCDDYITKPFNWDEFIARIGSVIRRAQQNSNKEQKRVRYGDLVVDLVSHRSWIGDKELQLAPREYAILELMITNPKRVYSRDELIEKVWGLDFDGDTKTVDVHICWLRQKIEEDPNKPKILQTVRGFGYRLGS